jgi:hypothetical protein
VQESALDVFLEQCAPLPRLLETEGKVPLPRKQVVRRMGTLLRLRQRANLSRDNFFDEPEVRSALTPPPRLHLLSPPLARRAPPLNASVAGVLGKRVSGASLRLHLCHTRH